MTLHSSPPPKLSKTTKLDGILSWSLPAVKTCPGARGRSGNLVPVCSGCYATEGNYRFAPVKALREFNLDDWQTDDWVQRMIAVLQNERYFRWFDSGDVYSSALAAKIYLVIQGTPWVKHWLPTRSYKVPPIRVILDRISTLPNASVRYSGDDLNVRPTVAHGSMVLTSANEAPSDVHVCPAYTRKPATCSGCRACWDKDVPMVGYIAHGRGMQKVVRLVSSPTIETTKVAS